MAASTLPPFRGIDWDDALEATPAARELIVAGHFRAELWIQARAAGALLDLSVVTGIHRTIFEGVWPDFAGKVRGPVPGYLPYQNEFGNHRGVYYEDVPRECDELQTRVGRMIRDLDDLRNVLAPQQFGEEVLKVASYTHCELIRIHPFVNGNGRTARTCINYFARRYGFATVSFERPTGEYIDAIQTWLNQRRIEHFMDFLRPVWFPS